MIVVKLWVFLKLFANVSLDKVGAADCWSGSFVIAEVLFRQLQELLSDGVSATTWKRFNMLTIY